MRVTSLNVSDQTVIDNACKCEGTIVDVNFNSWELIQPAKLKKIEILKFLVLELEFFFEFYVTQINFLKLKDKKWGIKFNECVL